MSPLHCLELVARGSALGAVLNRSLKCKVDHYTIRAALGHTFGQTCSQKVLQCVLTEVLPFDHRQSSPDVTVC